MSAAHSKRRMLRGRSLPIGVELRLGRAEQRHRRACGAISDVDAADSRVCSMHASRMIFAMRAAAIRASETLKHWLSRPSSLGLGHREFPDLLAAGPGSPQFGSAAGVDVLLDQRLQALESADVMTLRGID